MIKRRRKSRVIPGCSLGIVVNKVNPCSIGQTHFPATGQGPKLRDGLLLYRRTVCVLSIHANVLLTSRVDPRGCSRIVINKVGATFWGLPLFPACGQFASTSCRGSCRHHRHCIGRRAWWRTLWRSYRWERRVGPSPIFGQHTILMPGPLCLRLSLHLRALLSCVVASSWSAPCRLP